MSTQATQDPQTRQFSRGHLPQLQSSSKPADQFPTTIRRTSAGVTVWSILQQEAVINYVNVAHLLQQIQAFPFARASFVARLLHSNSL